MFECTRPRLLGKSSWFRVWGRKPRTGPKFVVLSESKKAFKANWGSITTKNKEPASRDIHWPKAKIKLWSMGVSWVCDRPWVRDTQKRQIFLEVSNVMLKMSTEAQHFNRCETPEADHQMQNWQRKWSWADPGSSESAPLFQAHGRVERRKKEDGSYSCAEFLPRREVLSTCSLEVEKTWPVLHLMSEKAKGACGFRIEESARLEFLRESISITSQEVPQKDPIFSPLKDTRRCPQAESALGLGQAKEMRRPPARGQPSHPLTSSLFAPTRIKTVISQWGCKQGEGAESTHSHLPGLKAFSCHQP